MQTFVSVLEQGVPSLTLLDMAKKKSKSSAMQYSLQISSSAQRTYTNTTIFRETCCLECRGFTHCKVFLHDRQSGAASAVMLYQSVAAKRCELENVRTYSSDI